MYETLLGSSGFRKGMYLYFERHDGHAVTCEDFFAAMRDANERGRICVQRHPRATHTIFVKGYRAPIRLDSDLTDDDLHFLVDNDSDECNRWEAGQVLARKLMLGLVSDFLNNTPLVLNNQFLHGIKCIFRDSSLDKEFIAKAMTLPVEGEIMDLMDVADPDTVHRSGLSSESRLLPN